MFKSISIRSVSKALPVVTIFSRGSASTGRGRAKGAQGSAVARKSRRGKGRALEGGTSVEQLRLRALDTAGFKGDIGETIALGRDGVAVGLGAEEAFTTASFRRVGAKLVRALDRMGVHAATIELPEWPARSRKEAIDLERLGHAFGEGMALANWRFDEFDGKASRRHAPLPPLALASGHADFDAGLQRGLQLGDAVNLTRRLGATPPNICHPEWVVRTSRALAKSHGLGFKVIDATQAQRLGMGGLVNVGRASVSKPALVMLTHTPRKPAPGARGEHLVLVGKTITYDTGGYSLKVNNGMKGMKYDKMGGMAVLGAMQAIATAKLPVRVTGILAVAENMIGGDAYRPDDIITMHNGVTVEVTNTDAEGRLVLADALSYACRSIEPTAIVDIATLTGGVVVALGHFSAGYFCEDDSLRRRLEEASSESGERIWRLPLWKEHRDFMRGQHADLINSNPQRSAHPIQGAAFLSFFVDDDIPWTHIDIAGVDSVERETDLHVTGPTGWGVRLLTELAEGFTRRAPRASSA
ncbi:MAG: leucyl aminopeptidase family protein [Phycisphaeraceae bacterium]|nr:leucyl aminopeptidase family protein [Phycisphaeraceae bacterium]